RHPLPGPARDLAGVDARRSIAKRSTAALTTRENPGSETRWRRGLGCLGRRTLRSSGGSSSPQTPADGAEPGQLDGDFQGADSGEVDPDPRITLDDLRERVAAVWAAENDPGATVDVNGANGSGCTTASTGPNGGCHLDREHLLQQARDRVAIQHQL